MRICGKCRGPLRFDENYERLLTPEGNYTVCPRCAAEGRGEPPPVPRRYERADVPAVGLPFHICGLCRVACFEDDNPLDNHLLLTCEDVAGTNVEPGGYALCRECRQHYEERRQRHQSLEGAFRVLDTTPWFTVATT